MSKDRAKWDVVLDDAFIQGAEHRELTASERAAVAEESRKATAVALKARGRATRKTTRKATRQERRRRLLQPFANHQRVVGVAVLLLLAFLWSRWPAPARPTVAASAPPTSVRVVYALPADTTLDPSIIPAIRQELTVVQDWFDSQTDGRHLRLVTDNGVASVDVRHLTVTAAELRNRSDAASLVDDELRPQTTSTTQAPANDEILLSFVPVKFPEQVRCGEGSQAGFAIVWMGSCGVVPSAGSASFGDGATFVMAHELVHSLGAVQPCAPHYGRNGHVVDDPRDLLYDGSSRVAPASVELDPGHDDYYKTGRTDCLDIADHPAWTK